MLKQEIASLEESLSSLEPGSADPGDLSSAPAPAPSASDQTPPAHVQDNAGEVVAAAATDNQPHLQIPRRISVGLGRHDADIEPTRSALPAAQAAASAQAVRPEDLVHQLTQLMSQNTELMTQLDEANSSLASSQELCNDLEVWSTSSGLVSPGICSWHVADAC